MTDGVGCDILYVTGGVGYGNVNDIFEYVADVVGCGNVNYVLE